MTSNKLILIIAGSILLIGCGDEKAPTRSGAKNLSTQEQTGAAQDSSTETAWNNGFSLFQCVYRAEQIGFNKYEYGRSEWKLLADIREFPFHYESSPKRNSGGRANSTYTCFIADIDKSNNGYQTRLAYWYIKQASGLSCTQLEHLRLLKIDTSHSSSKDASSEVSDTSSPYSYIYQTEDGEIEELRREFLLVRPSTMTAKEACAEMEQSLNSQLD